MANILKIPFIGVANDQQMLEMALVNIQRQNLNAIEIALSYQRLIKDNITQTCSQKVGKKRSTILISSDY